VAPGRPRRRLRAAWRSWLVVAALSAAVAGEAATGEHHFAVRRWTVNQGLPQDSVTAILQDEEGYLWIGTFGGLARFDGRTFKDIPTRGPGTPPLARVLALHQGAGGRIWVGTEGAGLLVVEGGSLVVPAGVPPLPGETINSVWERGEGVLWLGTASSGLLLVAGGEVRRWGDAVGVRENVGALLPLDEMNLVVASDVALTAVSETQPADARTLLRGIAIHALSKDRDGSLLVSTLGEGLLRVRHDGGVEQLVPPKILHGEYTCAARDPRGRVWASVGARGVFALRDSTLELAATPARPGESFRAMAADREGNLWLGSDGGGLVQLVPASFSMIGRAQGLPEEIIHPVAEGPDGTLWVGAGCAGIVKIAGDEVTVVGREEGLNADSCIYSLWPRRDGVMLAAGYRGEVWVIRGERVSRHPASPIPLPTALLEDRSGGVWVATRHSGVHRIEGGPRRTFTTADGLPANEVAALIEDEDGSLLVGTGQGVGVIRGERAFPLTTTGDPMLRAVRALLREGPRLWIGSYGDGLAVVEQGRLFRFTPQHGLPEGVVSFLYRDEAGFLWWTGNRGVHRARVRELVEVARGVRRAAIVRSFGEEDGLATAETNGGFSPAGWVCRNGRLLVPTPRGIAEVDPRRLAATPSPPLPRLVEVLLDGVPAAVVGGEVRIPPGTRRVQVSVVAPTFRAPERLRHFKRLQGFDDDWIDGGNSPISTFTGLPPGRYVFQARTANEVGEASPEVSLVTLRALPYFYQRRDVRVAAVVALGLFFAAAVAGRTASLRRRARQLERQVAQRTEELRVANARLEQLASTDELTGLANLRTFRERLEAVWAAARREGGPVSLIMLDVDHFKAYNDTFGHPAGDLCLRRIGAQLAASLYQASDLAARHGGEEFAILLPGATARAAGLVAERVRAAVESLSIPHPTSPVAAQVTVSAGHASASPAAGGGPEELIAAADAALYEAKRAGRNRVVAASPREAAVGPAAASAPE